MNGIPAETADTPATASAEQPKLPKKPRVAAHAADLAPSKAKSGHRRTSAKKANEGAKLAKSPKKAAGGRTGSKTALVGWAAAVGGFVFQAVALRDGQLSVVQPLLVTELVFVLVMRRMWFRQDMARSAWAAAAVVCVALGVFLSVAEPSGGQSNAETAEWLSALLAFGGAVALLTVAAMRGSPLRKTDRVCPGRRAGVGPDGGVPQGDDGHARDVWRARHAQPLAGVRAGRRRDLRHAARAGRPARGAAERVPAAADRREPAGQHRAERLAVPEQFTSSPARITVAALSFAVMAAGVTMLTRTAPGSREARGRQRKNNKQSQSPRSRPSQLPRSRPSPRSRPERPST